VRAILEVPDLAVGLFHVAQVLVYDPVESAVVDRAYDIVVACVVDDWRLAVVVPSKILRCWCESEITVPVAIVPFDVLP
jgi:hypothetical protein